MIKPKKAELMTWVVGGVVFLAVLAIFAFLLPSLKEVSFETGVSAACIQSLNELEQAKVRGGKLFSKLGYEKVVKCQTRYLETSAEGDELKREFADHIHHCFMLFGTRESLFDTDSGTYCIICKSIESKRNTALEGLADFLKRRSAPARSEMTYAESFGGDPTIPKEADSQLGNYQLTAGKSTAIIVTFGEKLPNGKYIVYNGDRNTGVVIHPYDQVSELGCYSFEGKAGGLELIDS